MAASRSIMSVAVFMRTLAVVIAVALTAATLAAQEHKPVPKDSARVSIAGCAAGYVFTAGPSVPIPNRSETVSVQQGTHLRMNGPRKAISAIDAYKESMIQITGLVKKDQLRQEGVGIGGGVRILPGFGPGPGGGLTDAAVGVIQIDVEGWNPVAGKCQPR